MIAEKLIADRNGGSRARWDRGL